MTVMRNQLGSIGICKLRLRERKYGEAVSKIKVRFIHTIVRTSNHPIMWKRDRLE